MESVRKFFIGVFALMIAIAVSVLVMIKGWGLEPKSWFWIIGVSLAGHIFAQLLMKLATSKD